MARLYCVIGLYLNGKERPSLASDGDGRPIVFDTKENAQDILPVIGEHRPCVWNDAGDRVTWTIIEPGKPSRAVIIEDYDPYDAPSGINVLSETHGMDWRHHSHWTTVFVPPTRKGRPHFAVA